MMHVFCLAPGMQTRFLSRVRLDSGFAAVMKSVKLEDRRLLVPFPSPLLPGPHLPTTSLCEEQNGDISVQ